MFEWAGSTDRGLAEKLGQTPHWQLERTAKSLLTIAPSPNWVFHSPTHCSIKASSAAVGGRHRSSVIHPDYPAHGPQPEILRQLDVLQHDVLPASGVADIGCAALSADCPVLYTSCVAASSEVRGAPRHARLRPLCPRRRVSATQTTMQLQLIAADQTHVGREHGAESRVFIDLAAQPKDSVNGAVKGLVGGQ